MCVYVWVYHAVIAGVDGVVVEEIGQHGLVTRCARGELMDGVLMSACGEGREGEMKMEEKQRKSEKQILSAFHYFCCLPDCLCVSRSSSLSLSHSHTLCFFLVVFFP